METKIKSEIKQQSISAIVTRANGKVENLGVISYYHRNPLMRIWWRVKRFVGIKR